MVRFVPGSDTSDYTKFEGRRRTAISEFYVVVTKAAEKAVFFPQRMGTTRNKPYGTEIIGETAARRAISLEVGRSISNHVGQLYLGHTNSIIPHSLANFCNLLA